MKLSSGGVFLVCAWRIRAEYCNITRLTKFDRRHLKCINTESSIFPTVSTQINAALIFSDVILIHRKIKENHCKLTFKPVKRQQNRKRNSTIKMCVVASLALRFCKLNSPHQHLSEFSPGNALFSRCPFTVCAMQVFTVRGVYFLLGVSVVRPESTLQSCMYSHTCHCTVGNHNQ